MEIQNVYGDLGFFSRYKELRAQPVTLNSAIENHAIRALLPSDVTGMRVLDIGCGFGDLTTLLCRMGAGFVLGIDPSSRMIDEARQRTDQLKGVNFLTTPVEEYSFASAPFDLIVSSLALHYVGDYRTVVSRISRSLNPGGRLLFSVEHPMCTAIGLNQWHLSKDGRNQFWPVDRYHEEGPRRSQWLMTEVVKYHRTTATYVNCLVAEGFHLVALTEPKPDLESIEVKPELADQCRRPPFLVVAADLPA